MNSESWSIVGFRNTGAVSRMKSFQNWPGSSSTSGAGPEPHQTLFEPLRLEIACERLLDDEHHAMTALAEHLADPDAVVRRAVGALGEEDDGGVLARHQRESAKLWNPEMAVKRDKRVEPVALPDVVVLTGARWFAGKGRAVAGIESVGGIAPDGARGASIVLVDVTYESGESERYALALRDGLECGGDDPLWAVLAGCAGVEAVPGRSRFLAEDLSNTVVLLDDRLVLKLFRRLERGPHPEAELLGALDGFAQVPELAGVVQHDGMTIGRRRGVRRRGSRGLGRTDRATRCG